MKPTDGNLLIIIPALSSSRVFQDDLLRKIAGMSLIQRTIDKAMAMAIAVDGKPIVLLTDIPEIRLIGDRNKLKTVYSPEKDFLSVWQLVEVVPALRNEQCSNLIILLLSPYAPLLKLGTLFDALKYFRQHETADILRPVIIETRRKLRSQVGPEWDAPISDHIIEEYEESLAFTFLKSRVMSDLEKPKPIVINWKAGRDAAGIERQQDWWVCEKLLLRKRIVFRVVGNPVVGMGHIYRALALAHEITDHEIIFVCDTNNQTAVNKLTGYDYPLRVFMPDQIIKGVLDLKPDLLINDILDTQINDVVSFQKRGARVVNFEDLGVGSTYSNVTINELYEQSQVAGKNILWGKKYFFVRDEFQGAKSQRFRKRVNGVLITFGGTDQHNMSRRTYRILREICQKESIHLFIVTGPGYAKFSELEREIGPNQNVTLTHATGVISEIMEQVQLAVTANGRTVYELAHMNIPAIVVSQHDREQTHEFANRENGFVPIGLYNDSKLDSSLLSNFHNLITNDSERLFLFNAVKRFRFNNNKKRVLRIILQQLSGGKYTTNELDL